MPSLPIGIRRCCRARTADDQYQEDDSSALFPVHCLCLPLAADVRGDAYRVRQTQTVAQWVSVDPDSRSTSNRGSVIASGLFVPGSTEPTRAFRTAGDRSDA